MSSRALKTGDLVALLGSSGLCHHYAVQNTGFFKPNLDKSDAQWYFYSKNTMIFHNQQYYRNNYPPKRSDKAATEFLTCPP